MNTNSYQITLGEVIIDVVRKDIKNINLAVYPPNGRVRISTPLKLDDEQVRLFAISKLSWIKKQQEKLQNQPRQTPREYVSGETHYFQGQPYRLNVIYQQLPPKVIIRNKSFLDLYVKQGSHQQQREDILIHWYRQELKKIVPPLIKKWQPIIGVEIEEWRIKKMKTKWGTCQYCSVKDFDFSLRQAEEQGVRSRERDLRFSPPPPAPFSLAVSTRILSLTE